VQETGAAPRHLIHERDAKFPPAFDTMFAVEVVEVVRTPHRTLTANAYAERAVRSLREECLDHLLTVNQAYLRSVLAGYAADYNHRRPHQGRAQRVPIPDDASPALPAPRP
jgi:putative transposase